MDTQENVRVDDRAAEKVTRKAGWRLMRDTVRPHRKLLILGILAGLGWAVARVAVPTLAGDAIDYGISKDGWATTAVWTVLILVTGAVQAVCTGGRRYAAFGLAWRVETDLRMKLVAHLQRLHFAFHDHAQTGQLMAYANTDIQQINNVILLIPLTIASTIQMVAVVVILVHESPGLGVVRARHASAAQLLGDAVQPAHVSRRHGVAAGAVGALRRRRRERHRRPRGEGFRRRATAAAPPVGRSRQRVRQVDGASAVARQLHAAHRPAADARPRRHPLVRRPSSARRQPDGRRPRRREPLRADVDLAAAHDRHARRSAAPIGRRSRPHQRGARNRSRDRRQPAGDRLARRARRRCVRGRDVRVRLEGRPAGAQRSQPRDPRWRSGRARGCDRVGQDHHRAVDPALLRRAARATCGSTAPTCATCGCATFGARSASCSRTRSCSPIRCATTSRSPTRKRRWTR